MAYKDKDRQREAGKERQRRYKTKQKALLSMGVTQGVTKDGAALPPDPDQYDLSTKRSKDIKCFADLPPDVQRTIDRMSTTDGKLDKNEKAKRTVAAIKYQHLFPDSYEPQDAVCSGVVTGKPGDADYNGVCTEEWRAERGR